jgi:hypothetical protein
MSMRRPSPPPSMPPLHVIALRDALPTAAHYGVSSDSSTAIRLIALSRLMRSKDDVMVGRAAMSPLGMAVLDALKGVLLRVTSDVVDPALSDANVVSLLNLPGSSTKYQSQYGTFGSLQSRLPWQRFRQLVSALFEALTAARNDQVGYQVGYRLIASTPTSPPDEGARVAIAALVAMVEPGLRARLAAGGGASVASSSSSDSSQRATPPPQLPQPPLPPSNLGIRADASLAVNLVGLIGGRIRRPLTPSEAEAVARALDEGLSVLQTGGTEARRQLLETNLLAALATQAGAWLWASALEAIERPAASITTLVANLVESCSLTASMLFADAAMAFTTEAAAGRSGPCTMPRRTTLGGISKGSQWQASPPWP